MKNKHEGWTCTDPDIGQYGRQLGATVFEFFTEGKESTDEEPFWVPNYDSEDNVCIVDITEYSYEDISSILDCYGYYRGPQNEGINDMNINTWHPADRNWIIAECIYEQEWE